MGRLQQKCSIFLVVLYAIIGHAQQNISGIVVDQNATPIAGASVRVVSIPNVGTAANTNGTFAFSLAEGTYTIQVSAIGYTPRARRITIIPGNSLQLTVILQQSINELNDVLVKGKTSGERQKEKAFEVEVIETESLKNTSVDITTVLNTIPGVNVRQRGGLGADFDFSLNGLSGKQIKFFLDGVPLENLGSALSLNNFPATLVDRVEVFKGVVPIHLGADALGGAVNVITNASTKDFLDVSYDVGSFNTHRATVFGQYVSDHNILVQLSSFYNYSDNDYTIDGIEVRDALGNDTGIRRDNVRRFHDAYDSQMLRLKTGLINKPYADRILLGLSGAANDNEIQHPIDPQNPFGEVTTENSVIQATLEYEKKKLLQGKLTLKAYASISQNVEKVIDTSSRKYDWFGGFIQRGNQNLGEFEADKTRFRFKDDLHVINAFAGYRLAPQHRIQLNYTKNYIKRRGEDPEQTGRIAFQDPHVVNKNILGLSYDTQLFNSRWNTTVFAKGYFLNSEGIIEDFFTNDADQRFTTFKNTFEELGYGLATTYKFNNTTQLKGSFERTFRIPEGFEVFGNGFLVKSNPNLLPEQSYNANLGFLWKGNFQELSLQLDTNVFFRDSENFIAIRSEGIFSRYYNTANARSTGVEGAIGVRYHKHFFLDVNATYQNIIDRNAGENSGIDFLRNQRIANIPYRFGNGRIGCHLYQLFAPTDQLTFSWDSYYVDSYPLTSFVEGDPEERNTIPSQFSHTTQLTYSFQNGRYNFSVLVRNVTDAKVFDNFEIQQPGRAFYVKFRYYITN